MAEKYDILEIDGVEYKTTYNKKWTERKKWQKDDPHLICAMIPGVIIKYKVKKGDKVRKDDSLFILEAMKMHNNILSPLDGKIKKIYVKEGENVMKNDIIIEIENLENTD